MSTSASWERVVGSRAPTDGRLALGYHPVGKVTGEGSSLFVCSRRGCGEILAACYCWSWRCWIADHRGGLRDAAGEATTSVQGFCRMFPCPALFQVIILDKYYRFLYCLDI